MIISPRLNVNLSKGGDRSAPFPEMGMIERETQVKVG
jgi:hypothetical protein